MRLHLFIDTDHFIAGPNRGDLRGCRNKNLGFSYRRRNGNLRR